MKASLSGETRLVIVGATGMVGGYALRYALGHSAVKCVTAIVRRKLDISHPKLNEVIHRDFANCSALAKPLAGQDAAVFCLGAYTGAVPDKELRTITVGYTIEFAAVVHGSSPRAAFSFLSGRGADPTGRSRIVCTIYGRGGECAPGCRISSGLHLSASLYLSGRAAEGTEFQLSSFPCYLPRVSVAVSELGDSGRRVGTGHGGRRRPRN